MKKSHQVVGEGEAHSTYLFIIILPHVSLELLADHVCERLVIVPALCSQVRHTRTSFMRADTDVEECMLALTNQSVSTHSLAVEPS